MVRWPQARRIKVVAQTGEGRPLAGGSGKGGGGCSRVVDWVAQPLATLYQDECLATLLGRYPSEHLFTTTTTHSTCSMSNTVRADGLTPNT